MTAVRGEWEKEGLEGKKVKELAKELGRGEGGSGTTVIA